MFGRIRAIMGSGRFRSRGRRTADGAKTEETDPHASRLRSRGERPPGLDVYRQSEPVRDGYFRGTALRGVAPDPGRVTIENPYWGDVAARFSWNLAFLPTGTDETFGPGEEAVAEVLAEAAGDVEAAPDQFLLALARQSLPRAVDCLWAVAAFAPADPSGGAALAAVGRKALAYVLANPNPPWLGKVTNDDQFAERLLAAVDSWTPSEGPAATEAEAATATATESFGISETWDRIKTAVAAVPGAVADLGRKARDRAEAGAAAAGTAAAGALINPLAAAAPRTFYGRFGLFLGDVFTYLNERGKAGAEGPIVKVVTDALRRAERGAGAGGGREAHHRRPQHGREHRLRHPHPLHARPRLRPLPDGRVAGRVARRAETLPRERPGDPDEGAAEGAGAAQPPAPG